MFMVTIRRSGSMAIPYVTLLWQFDKYRLGFLADKGAPRVTFAVIYFPTVFLAKNGVVLAMYIVHFHQRCISWSDDDNNLSISYRKRLSMSILYYTHPQWSSILPAFFDTCPLHGWISFIIYYFNMSIFFISIMNNIDFSNKFLL